MASTDGTRTLLISARDPGAAFQLVPIARAAIAAGGLSVRLVASGPAAGIFESSGLAVERFSAAPVDGPGAPGAGAVIEAARAVLDCVAPDALLVGLSGQGCGVDEALLHVAGAIPTYAMQDYWGDINQGWGALPGTYFVIDEEAARLTRGRTRARIVVIGSPRHSGELREDPSQVRDDARAKMGFAPDVPLVIFFGQPLHGLQGYRETLGRLAVAAGSALPGLQILYRSHPKEIAEECAASLRALRAGGVRVDPDPWSGLEASLCAADIACTCYSSCGLDHVFLSQASSRPLGTVLHLLFRPDVAEYFRSVTHLDDVPLSAQGLAGTVFSEGLLVASLRDSISPALRQARWETAQRIVKAPEDAARVAVRCVLEDLS